MLSASLDSLSNYALWMRDAGLNVTVAEDITRHVEPDVVSLLADRRQSSGALVSPRSWVSTLDDSCDHSRLMKQAYAQGAMAFGLFVARETLIT
jgi:hypothetical protein